MSVLRSLGRHNFGTGGLAGTVAVGSALAVMLFGARLQDSCGDRGEGVVGPVCVEVDDVGSGVPTVPDRPSSCLCF